MRTQVLLDDGSVAQGVVILTNSSTNAFANGQSGGGGDVQTLGTQLTESNMAQAVASVLRGKTTAGGGAYVDVKVTPSGALVANVTSDQLPASLGQKTAAQSMPVVIASDQSAMRVTPGVPFASNVTIMTLATSGTGANYTPFAPQVCTALDIVNNTDTTIEYRRGATGNAMQIPTGTARMVIGITNASQVEVRRTDTSGTSVTVHAEAFVN